MKLSSESICKIGSALKPSVIDYIYKDPGYAEYMQNALVDAVKHLMGDMDEELAFEIAIHIFDKLTFR